MRYSIGVIVEFNNSSVETDKGEIKLIEDDCNALNINTYNCWAYKVHEKKTVAISFDGVECI